MFTSDTHLLSEAYDSVTPFEVNDQVFYIGQEEENITWLSMPDFGYIDELDIKNKRANVRTWHDTDHPEYQITPETLKKIGTPIPKVGDRFVWYNLCYIVSLPTAKTLSTINLHKLYLYPFIPFKDLQLTPAQLQERQYKKNQQAIEGKYGQDLEDI